MPADNDDIIDSAVVRIAPDLTGFRVKLEKDLLKEIKGVEAKVKVVADGTGLKKSVKEAVTAQMLLKDQPVYKVRVVAQGGRNTYLRESVRAVVKEQMALGKQPVYKVKVVADTKGLKKTVGDIGGGGGGGGGGGKGGGGNGIPRGFPVGLPTLNDLKRVRSLLEKYEKDLDDAGKAAATREAGRVRSDAENLQRIRGQAQDAELARERQKYRTHDEYLAAQRDAALRYEQDQNKRAAAARLKVLEDEQKRRQQLFKTITKSQRFIDYGGQGVKPMNLLYGVVLAMTPALFAMGTSAAQAATSVAALGSAGIGAALGLSGVAVAFQGLGDVLSLRKQVQNEELTGAANAAQKAVTSADDLAQSKRALADAHREEETAAADLHKARREAIRDLEDLRQAVIDLDNQYRGDKLSVAEEKQNVIATDRNFFATALDRARARQDLRDAQTRLSDTALERRQKKEDLKTSVSKGVEGSDKVRAAKERVRDTRDTTLNAQAAMRGAKSTTGGIDKTSSAAAQLNKKLAELSPAARDMYHWFEKNEELFKRLQREISQKVLPGFQTFLDAITTTPAAGQKTTLQLAAEYAGDLGAIISKYAGKLGVWTKSALFRESMARIQERNAASFEKLGKAVLVLADPLIRIIDKAAPGFESFSDTILDLSIRFAAWIKKLDENGGLAKWFADSRREAGKWFDIAGNILELLGNLFTAAMPAGSSLVTSFQEFTQSIADWSGSASGQRQIKDFFEKVQNLPYAKIADFFVNATAFFVAFRTFTFLKNLNPILGTLGAIAAANPAATAQLFTTMASGLTTIVEQVAAHPEAAATILAILLAAKAAKAIGFDIKIPVVNALRDTLTSKFKVLDKFVGGGATTGTMTVHAGVVNVYGKSLGGGLPGKPGKNVPGAAAGGGLGLGAGITVAAIIAAVFAEMQYTRAGKGEGFYDPYDQFAKNPGLGTGVNALQNLSPIGVAAYGLGRPETKKFFSSTLPGWLGAGLKKQFPALAIADARKSAHSKVRQDEAYAMSRLKNNLESFGKDSDVTKTSIDYYIEKRRASVKSYVDFIRGKDGPIAADKEQEAQDKRSQTELSKLLVQYGWTKAAADVYTKQVFATATATKDANDRALAASTSFDSMGNSLDGVKTKAGHTNTQVGILKSTIDATIGPHIIALDTKGYDKVKKQLDMLYAEQHVLYNPTYSNSTKGADTISSQNQFLDPKSGLPIPISQLGKRRAAGGPIFGAGTSTSDSIPAWLSNGEYVMPAKTVEHYGLSAMDRMRKRELPAYAAGGPVMPFTVNLPTKGFQFPPVITPTGSNGAGSDQEYRGRTPRGLGAVAGLGLRMMAAVIDIHNRFPWASVNSGYRPGAITRTGNKSYHGFRRATDWPASMELFNYFVARYGRYAKEIIYSPAGNRQIHNGRQHMYTGVTRADHFNHVHLALSEGGPVRKFDSGGVLPPGYSIAFNGTGKNETVRTREQERAFATGPTRLDRRDLALLAQYVASATGSPAITMDGRKVAETTNRYNYLPAGV